MSLRRFITCQKNEKSFNKIEYDNKFIKENYILFAFRLRKSTDAEAIKKIKSAHNKSDYIRQLILKDIVEEKTNNKGS